MPDDKNLSELISQSMREKLKHEDTLLLESHLEENSEAKKFADISDLIQKSVRGLQVEAAETTDLAEATVEEFSDDIKERLKDSVNKAIDEKATLSNSGLINLSATSIDYDFQADFLDEADENTREIVSNFTLDRKLGSGGLGNVWLARDNRLNRNVAIKELKVDALENSKAWDRFHREAEITGHLEHPNIVPLYLYGVDRLSGKPFYAMRFVGKKNLATAIEEHHDRIAAGQSDPLALHRLLSIFLDICQAVAYAHSRGVIHRDLKPENIALDNFGQVIVIDWGLAKIIEESELAMKVTCNPNAGESALAKTVHGEVVGTPLYMSPEQASGKLDLIDKRTDIYGLGAILFSILTGYAPHANSVNKSSNDIHEFIDRISKAEPPTAADFDKSVSPDLEAIYTRAMALKPHLRFESVEDMAEAVEVWVAGQSGKQAAYETLRMEGRELRAEMQGRTRDLERNVRFASGLPPIEALMHTETDEDNKTWRKRLSTIFEGMLGANPDYRTIIYGGLKDNQMTEIVRVERNQDDASVRVVPKSRLRTCEVNDYLLKVSSMIPQQVHTSLVCDKICELADKSDCAEKVGLISSVPVYDDETEDIFGFVMIICDIESMLHQQLSRRLTAGEVIVACDVFQVMGHKSHGEVNHETNGQPIKEVAPHFLPAIEHLQSNTDYVNLDSDIFGARLWFIPNEHGIMYLLKR